MSALKDIQKSISEESSRAQSFTAHLQFMNEIGPKNYQLRIKKAFRYAAQLSDNSTETLEEVIDELEEFENELENDMVEDES